MLQAFSVYLGRMDAVWLARSRLNPRNPEPINLLQVLLPPSHASRACATCIPSCPAPPSRPPASLQWSDKLEASDPVQSIDDVDYPVMTNTVTLMIRGLGEILNQSRDVATAWGPFARRALAEKGLLAAVEVEIASWESPAPR